MISTSDRGFSLSSFDMRVLCSLPDIWSEPRKFKPARRGSTGRAEGAWKL
jgi:hypothetical protein